MDERDEYEDLGISLLSNRTARRAVPTWAIAFEKGWPRKGAEGAKLRASFFAPLEPFCGPALLNTSTLTAGRYACVTQASHWLHLAAQLSP